jgi:hypothetical protein
MAANSQKQFPDTSGAGEKNALNRDLRHDCGKQMV